MWIFSRLALALSLMSCSSQPQSVQTVPLSQMPGALRKTLCDKVMSCCSPSDLMANPKLGTTSESFPISTDAVPAPPFTAEFRVVYNKVPTQLNGTMFYWKRIGAAPTA